MSNQSQSNYINLITEGIGYLSRAREVTVGKGRNSTFWSADINMMHGEKGVDNGIRYVPFQVNPANQEAESVLEKFAELSNSKNHKVMVRVRVGDYYPETYTKTQGVNAGQVATVLKGRLLMITHVWVTDKSVANSRPEMVYERPEKEAAQEPESASAA
jgi:hypothetical protein